MGYQLLAIVGPTATGKTSLAVHLARRFPSVLISADSRQVYQGMDIVTGKDHPPAVTVHGLDLVAPNQTCSVAVWYRAVAPVLARAREQHLLPIVVGGTGLYVRALTRGIATLAIPPDFSLRYQLAALSVQELQDRLRVLAPAKLSQMNRSDRQNSRRLIRALEIASSPPPRSFPERPDTLFIALKPPLPEEYRRLLRTRVLARLRKGALIETRRLLSRYPASLPAFSALGYPHLIRYLGKKLTRKELIESWTKEELAYARRQLTWFKKLSSLHWFDASDPVFFTKVAALVKDWYHGSN